MGSLDGEIPALWFLISSIGFVILTFIQYRNTGKSFNTIFLSIMAIIFFVSYIILIPCHRVIRSDGALGGYSGRGGIKKKLRLLRSEKVAI